MVELLVSETRKKSKVGWGVVHEHCGKPLSHLGEAALIPERPTSVQRWRHKHLEVDTTYISKVIITDSPYLRPFKGSKPCDVVNNVIVYANLKFREF